MVQIITGKVQITERALLGRINRKLKHENQQVKKCRADSRGHNYLGDFYVVGTFNNCIANTHVDLEVLGKDLGVMAEYERLED